MPPLFDGVWFFVTSSAKIKKYHSKDFQWHSTTKALPLLCSVGPSTATVYRSFNEFKRARAASADKERSGRPLSAVTDKNVLAVKNLIQKEKRMT
ncbi:hypothetical protein EVAR_74791_1 [Eumeta japonica]|uniref:Uncharacterized protein n=1 Tax=Eumeta variegata TaxID=151549 RepID=A0A4C1SPW2_EUMVA|nr:hypothetical protein EVAR_74791_1 [Eumeta japonica]